MSDASTAHSEWLTRKKLTDPMLKAAGWRVEALFKLADAIEQRVESARATVEKTTQAILAKAFRGELVPTEAELAKKEGRDYESASVMLERIKAERAKAGTGKQRRKGGG